MFAAANLTEQAIVQELSRRGFPPFELTLKQGNDPSAAETAKRRYRPDAEIELQWKGRRRLFVVESRSTATPKQIDMAVAQLLEYTRGDRTAFPMLVAPYLSPSTLDRLAAVGVSGIDLSGNGVVTTSGEWFVLKTGGPNQYPSSAPIKNVYRGRSSLVCRALLRRREYPSVGAIADILGVEAGVTQATVSKVLKVLEEELLVARPLSIGPGSRPTIRLTQPAELLDRLVRNYVPPRATRVLRCVPTADIADKTPPVVLAAAAEGAGIRYAVDLATAYVPYPGAEDTPVYVESLTPLLDAGVIRENERFATLRLVETTDPTAYFDMRAIDGMWRVSPIQVYLELANGSKRDREISDTIRARILRDADRDPNSVPPESQ